jgi:hypothetical protein
LALHKDDAMRKGDGSKGFARIEVDAIFTESAQPLTGLDEIACGEPRAE